MPSYFYHLELELFLPPSPPSSAATSASDSRSSEYLSASALEASSHPHSKHTVTDPDDPSHVLRAAREALRPFLRSSRKSKRGKANGNGNGTPNEHFQRLVVSDGEYTDNRYGGCGGGSGRGRGSTATADSRLDRVSVQCIDMVRETEQGGRVGDRERGRGRDEGNAHASPVVDVDAHGDDNDGGGGGDGGANDHITKGIGTNVLGGLATKGRYVPLDRNVGDSSVWGIVHLYRDVEETPGLYDRVGGGDGNDDLAFLKGAAAVGRQPGGGSPVTATTAAAAAGGGTNRGASSSAAAAGATGAAGSAATAAPRSSMALASGSSSSSSVAPEDCTTLCILAVPSYLSPADFLGLVGEQTRDEVSHFRMVRTARANRYMVLMKFRSGRRAKEWQREWNGRVFNSMEPETCHVVFVKNVEIQVGGSGSQSTESRFPETNNDPFTPAQTQASSLAASSLSSKPVPPPTPALIELPTCPVCLERMDETTGLLTVICQHVFHCTCLQKWKGSGCPVCRYTQDDFGKRGVGVGPDGFGFDADSTEPTECNVCHSEDNLWLCLICGNVGCGRYDGAHAFDHFKQTAHSFTMDLSSQRVWDYIGDGYVHRIIQNKADGKLVELPAADHSALDPPDWADAVPREKWENMSVEYTHLLTSQLDSQRTYFEEKVERAADKAAQATAAATSAQEAAERAASQLSDLQTQHAALVTETIPNLERDKGRAERRAEKFETMARRMEKEWREEKAMNGSLLERVEHLDAEVGKLRAANEDLSEQNRDLTFFISGAEKLKDQGDDVVEGTVSVPESSETNKKKKKKKGKGNG